MKKNELLDQIKKLCDEEKSAIPVYRKHLDSPIFLSEFEPKAQQETREMLLTLAQESEAHARMFEDALKRVKESKQNVY